MIELITKINDIYISAMELEEQARQSPTSVQKSWEAANKFQEAAKLALSFANDPTIQSQSKIDYQIYSLYYMSCHHKSLSWASYIKHDTKEADKQIEKQSKYIFLAISTAQKLLPTLSSDSQKHFSNMIAQWTIEALAIPVHQNSIRARDTWNNGKVVTALDYYKETTRLGRIALDALENNNYDLAAIRIMKGNIAGMMANAEQVPARIILENAAKQGTPIREIPLERIIDLLKSLLNTIHYAEMAQKENPEWPQSQQMADLCRKNIALCLQECNHKWLELYIEFEGNHEIEKTMKSINMKKYNNLEQLRKVESNPTAKMTGPAALALIIFITIVASIYLFLQISWWSALLACISIPVLFTVITSYILFSSGVLSEFGFLKSLTIALQFQTVGLSGLNSLLEKEKNSIDSEK